MSVGIFVIGSESSGIEVNAWVRSYDPEAFEGRGDAVFTENPDKALSFADAGEALAFWTQTSARLPLRPDGRPNRPLTAFTVSIEPLPKD